MSTITVSETVVTARKDGAKPKDFETTVYYLNKTMEEILEYHKGGGECTCNLFADEMDDVRSVTVHDLRPNIKQVTLERNGFEIMPLANEGWDFLSPDDGLHQNAVQSYLDQLCQVVKAQ